MQSQNRTDRVFYAVSDPIRRKLLDELSDSEQTVDTLARPFKVSRPAISQHLGILRDAGLVKARRDGRHRYYRLRADGLRYVYDWVAQYERFWQKKLMALGRFLDEEANETKPKV